MKLFQKINYRVLLVGLFVLLVVSWFLFELEKVSVTEIDIHSGKVRHRLMSFGIVLSEQIEETAFSKLAREFNWQNDMPSWVIVCYCTQGLFERIYSVGEHYPSLYALHACESLMIYFKLKNSSRDEKREKVAEFLNLLRNQEILEMKEQSLKLTLSLTK